MPPVPDNTAVAPPPPSEDMPAIPLKLGVDVSSGDLDSVRARLKGQVNAPEDILCILKTKGRWRQPSQFIVLTHMRMQTFPVANSFDRSTVWLPFIRSLKPLSADNEVKFEFAEPSINWRAKARGVALTQWTSGELDPQDCELLTKQLEALKEVRLPFVLQERLRDALALVAYGGWEDDLAEAAGPFASLLGQGGTGIEQPEYGEKSLRQALGEGALTERLLTSYRSCLAHDFVAALSAVTEPNGRTSVVIFTDQAIVLVDSSVTPIDKNLVSSITLGTASHIQHGGFVSRQADFWSLTIMTTSGAVYTRYLPLAGSEAQQNADRQRYTSLLRMAASVYPISTDGGHATSEAGVIATYGIGIWHSLD